MVLSLRNELGGVFAIQRDWTDAAEPTPYAGLDLAPPILEVRSLLALRELMTDLAEKNEIVKEIQHASESAFADAQPPKARARRARSAPGCDGGGENRNQHARGLTGRGGER